MEPPNNPAEALDRLLWKITGSSKDTFQAIISEALSADVGTVEFVNRHTAAIGVVRELQALLEGLPEGHELKTRHLEDMPSYYSAVVYPSDWGGGITAYNIIDSKLIKLLGGLGTTLKVMAAGTSPVEGDIEKLEASLNDWEAMLDTANLPDGLTDQIRGQVSKIRDLLTQVDTLGYGPVIHESQSLLGYGIRAMKVARDVGVVATCVIHLFEFISHTQVQDWGSAANAVTGAFSNMGQALEAARQLELGGQPALERVERLAIEAKDAAEVVGEMVGDTDGPPESPTPGDGA